MKFTKLVMATIVATSFGFATQAREVTNDGLCTKVPVISAKTGEVLYFTIDNAWECEDRPANKGMTSIERVQAPSSPAGGGTDNDETDDGDNDETDDGDNGETDDGDNGGDGDNGDQSTDGDNGETDDGDNADNGETDDGDNGETGGNPCGGNCGNGQGGGGGNGTGNEGEGRGPDAE